ncbi:MAG: glycosyltransferase family 4 protein [Solirubrobacterales bacterium]
MTDEGRLLIAFALGLGATALATPIAIAIARRTDFFDHPVGYKQHAGATPYLGGAAVVCGLLAGSVALGGHLTELWVIVAAVVGLLAVGTLDDRVGLGIGARLAVELGLGALLYYAGFGWSVFGAEGADLLLTVVFVIGVINAYNLMDNLDGATPIVAGVSAIAIGLYATVEGDPLFGALGLALAGACAGFLPYNLATPRARIFLGDGGSMPIGATVAALIMGGLPGAGAFGWESIAVTVVLVGLPALDTGLVIFSRLRRGAGVLSGGRDHLTHRLLETLGSCRRVGIVLACGQAIFSALAIALLHIGSDAAAAGAGVTFLLGIGLIIAMESPRSTSSADPRRRVGAAVQDEFPV